MVIGGGPTGVEMAGAINEIATNTLKADFRSIDPTKTNVILLQSGDRILQEFPKDLSDSGRKQLEALGVEVRTGSRVTNIDKDGVYIGDTFIPAKTVVWGAGVAGSPLAKKLGVELDKGGRVLVNPDLSIPEHQNVFVAGDLAHFEQANGKGQVPGVAQGAIQGGMCAGRNILAHMSGQTTQPFVYDDRGTLATIGRNSAVGIAKGIKVKGFVAWLMWLFIHLYFLIGFENRLLVMMNWAYSYLSYNRSARLITDAKRDDIE